MEHFTAIKVIESLAGSINSSQDPKGVLTKYANENNLSPAELERLGQVYNSAKTLSHLEKSANRGDTYKLMDIEDLVNSFASYEHKQELGKSASAKITNGGSIPNLFSVETLEKKASQCEYEHSDIFLNRGVNTVERDKANFLRELPDTIHELSGEINKQANNIAKEWFNKNLDPKDLLDLAQRLCLYQATYLSWFGQRLQQGPLY